VAVAALLVEAMAVKGVSRAEMMRRTGMRKGSLSPILCGRRNLSLRTVSRIADALGVWVEVRLV
jgi:transcriptional regulator with XRE-family HTH domain